MLYQMKTCTLTLLLTVFSCLLAAQNDNQGGGAYEFPVQECITPAESAALQEFLSMQVAALRAEGKLPLQRTEAVLQLAWPVRQSEQYSYNSMYGISNFVDHDPVSGNGEANITDYQCGSRSYDLPSGYDHDGTDIFVWPYQWQALTHDQVEIVAAAPGNIIYKSDGNYDRNCS